MMTDDTHGKGIANLDGFVRAPAWDPDAIALQTSLQIDAPCIGHTTLFVDAKGSSYGAVANVGTQTKRATSFALQL